MSKNIAHMATDAHSLTDAAVRGELSYRAHADDHEGDYKKIISGINATLDAYLKPMKITASFIDEMAHGEILNLLIHRFPVHLKKSGLI